MTEAESESGIEHGRVLTEFAEAMVEADDERLADARAAAVTATGATRMVDAAGVASNFQRMVRIADATGIELGEGLERVSAPVREDLGLRRRAER